jgi:hypothetical protein
MIKILKNLWCKFKCFGMEIGMARASSGLSRLGKTKEAKNLLLSLGGTCRCNG